VYLADAVGNPFEVGWEELGLGWMVAVVVVAVPSLQELPPDCRLDLSSARLDSAGGAWSLCLWTAEVELTGASSMPDADAAQALSRGWGPGGCLMREHRARGLTCGKSLPRGKLCGSSAHLDDHLMRPAVVGQRYAQGG
jgi:hypothetical protein